MQTNKQIPDFLCFLCQKTCKIPQQCTNCLSMFCYTCINEFFTSQKQEACPNCYAYSHYTPQPKYNSVRELFECQYKSVGCAFKFQTKDDCEEHALNCRHFLMKCPHKPCQKKILKYQIYYHLVDDCENKKDIAQTFQKMATSYHSCEDQQKAQEMFYQAGEQGIEECYMLSAMLAQNTDKLLAVDILKKAANKDNKMAIHQLAVYVLDKQVQENVQDDK